MMFVRVMNHSSANLAKILIENWLCLLFLGVVRIDLRNVWM